MVKNPPANAGDMRDTSLIPGLERSLGWGNGNLLQYSCLENSVDPGADGLQSMGLQWVRHNWSDLAWHITDCSLPGSFVYGISQARIFQWVAVSSSRGSSQPRDETHIFCGSCIGRWTLCHWATWEAWQGLARPSYPWWLENSGSSPRLYHHVNAWLLVSVWQEREKARRHTALNYLKPKVTYPRKNSPLARTNEWCSAHLQKGLAVWSSTRYFVSIVIASTCLPTFIFTPNLWLILLTSFFSIMEFTFKLLDFRNDWLC